MKVLQKTLFKNKITVKKRNTSEFNELHFYNTNSAFNSISDHKVKHKQTFIRNFVNTLTPYTNTLTSYIHTCKTSNTHATERKHHITIHSNSKLNTEPNTNPNTISRAITTSLPTVNHHFKSLINKTYTGTKRNTNRDILCSFTKELEEKDKKIFSYKRLNTEENSKIDKPTLLSYPQSGIVLNNNSLKYKRTVSKELKQHLISKKKIEMDTKAYNLKNNTEKYFFRDKDKKYLVKYKDECFDTVGSVDLYYSYFQRKVRECLQKDLNAQLDPYIHDLFYFDLANKVNFIDDIYHVPVLKNNFLFKDKTKRLERLTQPNFINKEYKVTLNRARRERIFKEDEKRKNTYYKIIIKNVTYAKEKFKEKEEEDKLFKIQIQDYLSLSKIAYKGVKIIPNSDLKSLIYKL